MPTLETLTEADLRRELAKSVNKGYGYVSRVKNPTRSGQTLSAQVQGGWLYEVQVIVEPAGISSRCGCSWGGNCKHVAALLLKWLQSPDSFSVTEPPVVLHESTLDVIPIEPLKTHRPEELPRWITNPFADRRRAESLQFKKWAEQISLPNLRSMAKERGWQVRGNNKQAVVEQIAERMLDPDDIARAVRRLDAEHQHVLCAMVLLGSGDGINPQRIEPVATAWGDLAGHKQIKTYTGHLCGVGLAIPGHALNRYYTQDFVPDVMTRYLAPALDDILHSKTGSPTDKSTGQAAPPLFADPYPFVRTVNQIALLLEQSAVPLRTPMPRPQIEKFYPLLQGWDYDAVEVAAAKQGRKLQSHGYSNVNFTVPPPRYSLPDEAIQRLAPVAGGEARLDFIYALLAAAGYFQPGSPVTVWPEVKTHFMRLDELAQRATLARVYFSMANWSELWELLQVGNLQLKRAAVYSHYKPDTLRTDLVRFRWAALRVLACLPDDQWVALDDLFRLMRLILPRFDQAACAPQYYGSGNSSGAWFLTRPGSETPLDTKDNQNWDMVQGNFIRQIIAGPLHWLGLADLGKKKGRTGDVLVAFRLHGLADLFWDCAETPPAPLHVATTASARQDPGKAMTAEGVNITVNPSAIKAQAHGLLERIAHLDVAAADRFVYRLDAQAVYRSFEAGMALSEITGDWERLLPVPMPKAIRAQLTQWWEAYGRVRIYENLTVIEFGDDYALAEMKATTSLEQHLIAEISPRLVLVNKEAVPTLTTELEKAGYTPKQTEKV